MKINLYTKNFELNEVENNYLKEKIEKIKKYSLVQDDQIINVKIEKDTHHENGKDSYSMSIDLNVKGKDIHIEKSGNTVFSVIDMTEDILSSEIRQYKDILTNNKRK
ncbi:HPF/RaiA family ribosome-associated protein [Patescibacteria group bacterium]|nr:HPF/RaiA family ribosome-associated protein [Patescibacteria group bacterium]